MNGLSNWALSVVFLAACGPSVDLGMTGTGSAGSDSSPTDDGVDGTGPIGEDGCEWSPAPLPGVFDPGPQCIDFVSPEEVAPVTIRVVNDGDSVINLVGPVNCVDQSVRVQDSADQYFPVPLGNTNLCGLACEGVMMDECGCLAACFKPDTIALQPGRHYEFEWAGFVWQPEIAITDECASEACAGVGCSIRVPPAAGDVEFTVATAEQFVDCDNCECTPNEDGWCVLEPGDPEDVPQLFSTTVEWPPPCPLVEIHVP